MCCSERRRQTLPSQYHLHDKQELIQPLAQQRRQRQASYREAQRRSVFDASSNFNIFDLFPQQEKEPEATPIKQARTFPEYSTHQRRARTSTYRDAHRQSVFHDSSNFNIYDLFPRQAATEVSQPQQGHYSEHTKRQHSAMAAIIWVGMAIGAKKLGDKISEKRAEKKKLKAEQQELMYGNAESSRSTSHVVRNRSWDDESRPMRKSEEARRERRRSVSSERSWSDSAPPRYEEAVRGDRRRS